MTRISQRPRRAGGSRLARAGGHGGRSRRRVRRGKLVRGRFHVAGTRHGPGQAQDIGDHFLNFMSLSVFSQRGMAVPWTP